MGDDGQGDDPDRAAILKRRNRFIALALTGMATVGCGGGSEDAEPMPCLEQVQPDTSGDETTLDDGEEDPPPDADPMPCLEIARPGDD